MTPNYQKPVANVPSPMSSTTYYSALVESLRATAAASSTNEPCPTTSMLSLNMSFLTVTSLPDQTQ